MRRVAILLVLAFVLPIALAGASQAGTKRAACADVRILPGVGPACPRADGLFDVLAPDGSSRGTTHGADPLGPEVTSASARGSPVPSCVAPESAFVVRPVYARPYDGFDGYASKLSTVRGMVADANRLVDDAAIATGGHATLRVPCVDGVVLIQNATLPTAAADATFGTIVDDLMALGDTDPTAKYVVYYDDAGVQSRCGCGGIGHFYSDSRPGDENWNNGNADAMFAVDFGAGVGVWLHELGHNLGAVQLDAPHTSGGAHCIDGNDIMCYNDGGWNARNYTTSRCASALFDCGADDYFNRNPSPGSYLDAHWNIGGSHERFLDFGDPVPDVQGLACAPLPTFANLSVTCSWFGQDDGDVSYAIDWGDGASARVPDNGAVDPNPSARATHAWSAPGDYAVRVAITDLAGQTRSRSVPILVKPPCDYAGHEGALLLGLGGVQLEGVSSAAFSDINPGCQGAPWRITLSSPAPRSLYEVCWIGGAIPACDRTGWGSGRAPADATGVVIVLDAGAQTAFWFEMG